MFCTCSWLKLLCCRLFFNGCNDGRTLILLLVADLVRKLNSKGRQLIAVKIVYALNVSDKFPAVPLLKAYLTESRQRAVELRKKGNNSERAKIAAIHKEMGKLKSVLNAIEQYKLESEFPREKIFKRIVQLRMMRAALSVDASNSMTRQNQQSNKRPRPSPDNSYHKPIQPHPQWGWAEGAPYLGVGPSGLAATDGEKKKNTPKLEPLKFLCINMDAKGLRSCLNANRNYSRTSALFTTLGLALRSAPDPALLILDAMDEFHPPRNPPIHKTIRERKGEFLATRKACIYLLEMVYPISFEFGIKPSVRERALSLALEWKARMAESEAKVDEGDNEGWGTALQALGFLRLIAAYRLVPEFEADDVMELLCSFISRKKMTADLVESLGLADKVHDLVWKLNSKGRQLIAIDMVYALNVSDKFPALPLLKAYISESKHRADELRKKGNNSEKAQIVALQKEMGSLKAVLKVIEQYKLESEYPRDNLFKMIALLHKKLAALSVGASNSKTRQNQQSNKRPNSYQKPIQPHLQWGWAEGAPYLGVGPSGLATTGFVHNHNAPLFSSALDATGSVYNHGGPSLSCIAMHQGATHSRPRSYYSSDSLAGTSRVCDRLVTIHGHHMDGLPSSYGSHPYP